MPTWSIHVRPCPAVWRCHPSFVKVRCNWSIRVASVFHSFVLVRLPVFGTFARAARSTCHLCSAVFFCTLSVFYTARCGWSINVSSELCSFFCVCILSFYFTVLGDWFIHVSSVVDRYFGSHPPSPRRGAGASLCGVLASFHDVPRSPPDCVCARNRMSFCSE